MFIFQNQVWRYNQSAGDFNVIDKADYGSLMTEFNGFDMRRMRVTTSRVKLKKYTQGVTVYAFILRVDFN